MHEFFAALLNKCFELIAGKNYWDTSENYEDILEFTHPDFLNNNITANDFGRIIAEFKYLGVEYSTSIPQMIQNATKIQFCPGILDWNETKNMNKTELFRNLQVFNYQNKQIQFYGFLTPQISDLLSRFIPMTLPLLLTQDQSNILLGSPGLNYVSTGLAIKELKESNIPKLSGTLILAATGVKKLPLGFVYPTMSKSEKNNQEFLRLQINEPDPLPEDSMIFANANGYSTGKIMAVYYAYVLSLMPNLPKLLTHDIGKPNVADPCVLILDDMNVLDKICPSYLTGDIQEMDQRFIREMKNETP